MPPVTPPTKLKEVKQEEIPKCRVSPQPDGGLQVHFLIDPDAAKRLARRAGSMPLERYLWENVLNRAVSSEVY